MKEKELELPDFAEGINLHGERLRLETPAKQKVIVKEIESYTKGERILVAALTTLILSLAVAVWIMIIKML